MVAPRYGPEVVNVLARLSSLGRAAVFGGALRDLALRGSGASPRDIDVVMECDSQQELSDFLAPYCPQRNKYGGFRFRTERWSFDVWRAQDTWAVRQGLVAAGSLDDLIRTTFFDWDAVLYEHRSGTLTVMPGYFTRLSSCVVDVNLLENPNPLGNLIRALRVLARGRACLGPQLMIFAFDQLGRFGDREILAAEAKSFRHNCLSSGILTTSRTRLESALERGEASFGGYSPTQLEFDAVQSANKVSAAMD